MFAGSYEHTVDAKGRLAIPARFRPDLADGLVLCKGFEKCVRVFGPAEWQRVSAQMIALPDNLANARRLRRAVFGSAFPSELDGHGRVVLPGPLREYAGINDSVMVIGAGNYFEIWDSRLWMAENALIDEDPGRIAESIELPR